MQFVELIKALQVQGRKQHTAFLTAETPELKLAHLTTGFVIYALAQALADALLASSKKEGAPHDSPTNS